MFRFSFIVPFLICGALATGLFLRPATSAANCYYYSKNSLSEEKQRTEDKQESINATDKTTDFEEYQMIAVEKIMKESARRTRDILEGRFNRY